MDTEKRQRMKEAYQKRVSAGGVYVLENASTGKKLLLSETDLTGAENRFRFMQMTGSCPNQKLRFAWKESGPEAFRFQVLERLEQKEEQTKEEFLEDLKLLEEIWREKLGEETLY